VSESLESKESNTEPELCQRMTVLHCQAGNYDTSRDLAGSLGGAVERTLYVAEEAPAE